MSPSTRRWILHRGRRSRMPSAGVRTGESGRYDGGFQRFAQALTVASIWRRERSSATANCRASPPPARSRHQDGGLQPSDLIIVAPPRHARPRSPPTCLQRGEAHRAEVQPTGTMKSVNGALSASSPAKCRPNSSPPVSRRADQYRSSTIRRGITESLRENRDYSIDLQSLRSMSTKPAPVDLATDRAGAPPEASEGSI